MEIFKKIEELGLRIMPPSVLNEIDEIKQFTSLKCPFCSKDFTVNQGYRPNQISGIVNPQSEHKNQLIQVHSIRCSHQDCKGSIVYHQNFDATTKQSLSKCYRFYPKNIIAGLDMQAVPKEVLKEYQEALNVISISPNSTAMILRRLLSYMLVKEFNADKKANLFNQLDEAEKHNNCTTAMKDELDNIRNSGNLGAHGDIKDSATLQDVEVGNAEIDLELMERFIEVVYVQPYEAKQRKARLAQSKTSNSSIQKATK